MRDPLHVALTGASSGIGAALARAYAKPGRCLSLSGRDAPRLAAVAESCRARGASVHTAAIDVRDTQAMAGWIEDADARRPIDLVIANAGTGGRAAVAMASGETAATVRHIMDVNVIGVANTIAPLLPVMAARRRGQVAIVSSLAGLIGLPDSPAYCASKAALRIYGDGLRRLMAPQGVSVSLVYPGFVATPMSGSLPFRPPFLWTAERAADYIAARLARGRATILFPWQLRWALAMGRLLPRPVVDAILSRIRAAA